MVDGFLILSLWGGCLEGAERATRQRLRFLLFQMEFGIAPALFLSFLPYPQIYLPKGRGFSGAPNPAWIGRFQVGTSVTLMDKGLVGRALGDALFTRVCGYPL